MLVIGELINSSRPLVRDAMESRNAAVLLELAQRQKSRELTTSMSTAALSGRTYRMPLWLIPLLQDSLDVQISIDSANASVILDALSLAGTAYHKLRDRRLAELSRVFAAARDREARVSDCACLEHRSPPLPARRGRTRKLLSKAADSSFPLHDLFLDPLVSAMSACASSCRMVLDSLAAIKSLSADVRTVCGLSNISFGMPARRSLNRAFLPLLVIHGLGRGHSEPDRQRTHGEYSMRRRHLRIGGGSA